MGRSGARDAIDRETSRRVEPEKAKQRIGFAGAGALDDVIFAERYCLYWSPEIEIAGDFQTGRRAGKSSDLNCGRAVRLRAW